MFTLTKTPDKNIILPDFEEYFDLNFDCIAITGNRDFCDYGRDDIIAIIKGDYYDDETGYDYDLFDELEKVTGKQWERTIMRGYSQRDWQYLYFAVDYYSAEKIQEIKDFYFGKVQEFVDEDYCAYLVPDRVAWNGKRAICEYLGLDPEETKIFVDDGYKKVWNYKELD